MKQSLLTSVLLLLSAFAFAQNSTVKGKIVDSVSNAPLEYASAMLYKASDAGLVTGVVSGAGGLFEIGDIKEGKYFVEVQFIGYNSKKTAEFTLRKGQDVDLGAIVVSPSTDLLQEIMITGERLTVMNQLDRQTYAADQFESAKGGTAIDVLKNMPSVSVNGQGEITMRGSTGFLVMINGKPVLTDAQTALSQLPANAVENIELITAPSAKYDPDGKAGMINIITKKGVDDGFTLVANAQGGLPSTRTYGNIEDPVRFGGDVMFSYRKNQWDIAVSGNYTRSDVAGYRDGDVFTKNFEHNTFTRFPSQGERSFNKYNYAGRATVNFKADDRNSVSMGFYHGKRYQSRRADILYNNTTSDLGSEELISRTTYFNTNVQAKEGDFTLGNIDYTHTFENESALTVSALYERADLYGNTKNGNLYYPDMSDTMQYVFNPYKNPIDGYRFKVDYAVNIGPGKLESGYQFRYDSQDGQFDYFVTPETSQEDIDRFRGRARTRNRINSVYSQYSGSAGKIEYVGGLRYEYASRTVNLSYDPEPHKLNLSNLFPSASIMYNFAEGWKAKAGYSRRVERTTNYKLNPIPEREHSETLEQGDPDLLPEFINLAELGLIRSFNTGSVFTTLYYQDIQNPIQRVNSVYADTILNRVYTNAERARSFGMELGTNIQPVKWWNLYLGANVFNYKIKGDLTILGITSSVSNANWAYSINMNTDFQLGASWNLQGNMNYLSERPTAQGEDSRFLSPNLSLKKTFMGGRCSAMIQWQNIDLGVLGSNEQRISTWADDFYTTTNYIYETDVLMVGFSFNLNKAAGRAKLPNSEFGDKEF